MTRSWTGPAAPYVVNVQEPAPDEVAIVVNNNAGFGTHAGMFVGTRLSDPAGSYAATRRYKRDWSGPSLRDYVEFQMEDGNRIQIFRFKLEPRDFGIIDGRVAAFGVGRPAYCAADVRDQLAGVGPFRSFKPAGWITPSALAEALLPLIEGPAAVGTCVWPSGQACRPTFNNSVVAKPASPSPQVAGSAAGAPEAATAETPQRK